MTPTISAPVLFVPLGIFASWRWPFIAQLCVILPMVAVGLARSRRRLSSMGADLAIWVAIGIALLGLYSYRFELRDFRDRLLAELIPGQGQSFGRAAMRFKLNDDREFEVTAQVNGQPVRFLIDTGATGVVLNQADASRLGFDPRSLDYSEDFWTANGSTRGAPVRLGQIQIGPIHFDDVPASVNLGVLPQSLLGMQFLARLSRVEIDGDTLVIRQ